MLIKVPYVDKNDSAFYDIIKNESNLDSFFCYEVKNNLVYVNKKNKFDIRMPKLIKKLYGSAPEENFIIIEYANDSLHAYINNGEKDFEYYEYSNTEQPLQQLFMSLFSDGVNYNIYYIEDETLRIKLKNVINFVLSFRKIDLKEEDLIPVSINITNQDIEDFFTKVSLDEKIKNKINEIKNKIYGLISKRNNFKQKKKPTYDGDYSFKTIILSVLAGGLVFYYLYSNDYFKPAYEYFFPAPIVEVVEMPIVKPTIDMGKVNLLHNYNLYKYLETKIDKKIDLLEYSNGNIVLVGAENIIENPKTKFFIDNNIYIMEDVLGGNGWKEDEINNFINFESIEIEKFIEYKSENQIILKVKKEEVKRVINQLLSNDKLKYNINIYTINDIYQIILYSDNIIKEINGKVKIKQEIKLDTGSFSTK